MKVLKGLCKNKITAKRMLKKTFNSNTEQQKTVQI